jgi:hypothetical protein
VASTDRCIAIASTYLGDGIVIVVVVIVVIVVVVDIVSCWGDGGAPSMRYARFV